MRLRQSPEAGSRGSLGMPPYTHARSPPGRCHQIPTRSWRRLGAKQAESRGFFWTLSLWQRGGRAGHRLPGHGERPALGDGGQRPGVLQGSSVSRPDASLQLLLAPAARARGCAFSSETWSSEWGQVLGELVGGPAGAPGPGAQSPWGPPLLAPAVMPGPRPGSLPVSGTSDRRGRSARPWPGR